MVNQVAFTITDLSKMVRRMQQDKFDAIIVFTGNRGTGKSTGAIKLAQKLKPFKMHKDIVFSREDLMNQLAEKKYGTILADEMIAAMHNREFWSREQIKIIKMLNMYRDSFNVLICCIPNFADLDKQFRNLVKIRIDVVKRGLAVIHTQNPNNYSSDPWDMSLNDKIEKKFWKGSEYKPKWSRLSTFRGYLHYGKLDHRVEKKYVKIKADKRSKVVAEGNDNKQEFSKSAFYNSIYEQLKNGKITKNDLRGAAKAMNLNLSTVERSLYERSRNDGVKLSQLFSADSDSEIVTSQKERKMKTLPL